MMVVSRNKLRLYNTSPYLTGARLIAHFRETWNIPYNRHSWRLMLRIRDPVQPQFIASPSPTKAFDLYLKKNYPMTFQIVSINQDNLEDHPQVICFINPKHSAYHLKMDWLGDRFREGMRIKMLYIDGEKRPVGFIEYTPGEYCWRAVSAKGYLFIHCIWISSNKYKQKGFASLMLEDCLKDAEDNGFSGVAAMTSSGSFMADHTLFLKHGFRVVDHHEPDDDLLIKALKDGPLPRFIEGKESLPNYRGWHILFSRQCPWVARFIRDGRILADRYFSETRFRNILKKEGV
ncbi:MAG: N-acetyltransferase [Bacteroidetes bacterium]|nr:MAG: N-acetyltransferase [Bacteroidota bacterium]